MPEKNTVMKYWNGTAWVDVNTKTTIALVEGLQDALDDKVDIVAGKQLSTQDYTTADQTKVATIPTLSSSDSNKNIKVNSSGTAFECILPTSVMLTFTAGETIAAYSAVRLGNDKKLYVSSNTTTINAVRTIGIALNGGSLNDNINVVCMGLITNTSWSWTLNDSIYLAANSVGLTNTPPESGVLLLIGQAISTDSVYVHISTPSIVFIE